MENKRRAFLSDTIVLALFAVMMIVFKEAMAALPNIEPVSLLCCICSVLYGRRALASVGVFIIVEGLLYGFHVWWIAYLYLWPLCCLIAQILRKADSAVICAILMALFGLCFGALSAIPYLFIGGFPMAFAYWLSGISFDLLHCAGNFAICLLLYRPLITAARRILKKVPSNAYLK